LIDVKTGERHLYDLENTFSGIGYVNYAAFSPNGEKIIIGDTLKGLMLLDLKSGAVSSLGYTDIVAHVGFSPDGTKVIAKSSGYDSPIIIIYDLLIEEQSKVLGSLYDCDLATALLLYRICLGPKDKITFLSDSERDIFNSLPEFVQDLLARAVY